MRKRTLVLGLTAVVALSALTGCGSGSSTTTTTPAQGTLYVFIGDQPACNAVSYRMTLEGLSLVRTDGTLGPSVLSSSSSIIKVNFGDLKDAATVLHIGTVGARDYGQANLKVSIPEIVLYDPTQTPPVKTINLTLSNAAPTVTIAPTLSVTAGKINALLIDFDMLRSMELDSQGNVTDKAKPVFSMTPLTASVSQPFIHFDNLSGFIRSVTTSSTSGSFVGGFLLQMLSASVPAGPTINVSFTKDTVTYLYGVEMTGAAPLDQILPDSYVELDGDVDYKGNLVANNVEIEYQEDPSINQIALIGPIVQISKDSSGNVSGFSQWIREEEPDDSSQVVLDTIAQVTVSPATTFQYSSRSANFAGLTFDSTGLAVGQDVVVHGTFNKTTSTSGSTTTTTITVPADKVYLPLQTLQGNFASLVQAGSDDKTGAFQLTPCCTLLQGTPIMVFTNYQTSFLNVAGLSELTVSPTLSVRGLPFFEPSGGTISGVTVPPGTLVVLAEQVHQLQ